MCRIEQGHVTVDPPQVELVDVRTEAKEVEMSGLKRFLVLLGAVVFVAGCAPAETEEASTSEAPTSTATSSTRDETTTSSALLTTSSTIQQTTTSSAEETTAPSPSPTVQEVVAVIQSDLDEEFAASEPMEGVLGPYQVQCRDSGFVAVDDVFACAGFPQSEPDFPLDPTGIVIYVVDEAPTVAWLSGTDVPDRTERLIREYELSPKGLYCRDLLDQDTNTWFSAVGTLPTIGYFMSLVYWSLEGRPDRMDADRNGIPCETVHESDVIEDVLDGGRVH